LLRILRSFGVSADEYAGKGSHIKLTKDFADGHFSYPIPKERDVNPCYVKGCRKRFRLRLEDGISDEDFFGR